MNIELQKYYTDNKSRITYIDSEIATYKYNIDINKIYESYSKLLTQEICYIFMPYSKITFYDVKLICKSLIKENISYSGDDEYWNTQLDNVMKSVHNEIDLLTALEECIMILCRFIKSYENLPKIASKLKERINPYLKEIRDYKKDILDKREKYLPKIESLNKEKEMLEKINKQIEEDYKNEIILL